MARITISDISQEFQDNSLLSELSAEEIAAISGGGWFDTIIDTFFEVLGGAIGFVEGGVTGAITGARAGRKLGHYITQLL